MGQYANSKILLIPNTKYYFENNQKMSAGIFELRIGSFLALIYFDLNFYLNLLLAIVAINIYIKINGPIPNSKILLLFNTNTQILLKTLSVGIFGIEYNHINRYKKVKYN